MFFQEYSKFWFCYSIFFCIVCIVAILGLLGVWSSLNKTKQKIVHGVEQTTFGEFIASVENHELKYEKRYVELDAEIERRLDHDTIMLSTFQSNDNVWWYVNTHESNDGHKAVYGYKVGETYTLKMFIRDLEYKPYENDNKGRYYVWSEIAK